MEVIQQNENTISFKFERFDGENFKELFTYETTKAKDSNFHILGYNYTETVSDLAGNFTISVYEDNSAFDNDFLSAGLKKDLKPNKSFWSCIKPLDVVTITEGKKIFQGIIHTKNFKSMVGNGEVQRVIDISGQGIHSLYSLNSVCMDAMAGSGKIASMANVELTANMATLEKVADILNEMWKSFSGQDSQKVRKTTFIEKMIKKIFGEDFTKVVNSNSLNAAYPIASTLYDQNTCTFYDAVKALFPDTAYEVFGYWDSENKPKIQVREKPFDKAAWNGLGKSKKIPYSRVTGYSINQTDSEVYTAFLPFVEGAGYSGQVYRVAAKTEQDNQNQNNWYAENDKMAKYGFRLLQCDFKGCTSTETDKGKATEKLKELTNRLMEWYSYIDEMLNGTISIVTDVSKKTDSLVLNPGEKINFCGIEFYINEVEHIWQYGESPTTNLKVTRGGIYTGGAFDSKKTMDCDITKRFSEFKSIGVN